MAEPRGRPKTLVRRHVLEIKKDTREWIEGALETFTDKRTYGKTSRVIGAGIAAAGIYTMVRLVTQFGAGIAEGIKSIQKDIFLSTSIPVINFFTSIFGVQVGVKGPQPSGVQQKLDKKKVHKEEEFVDFTILEELGQFDPFAFGAALTAGGMVLAGLNPGEILKGIGSIIDALIPL